MKKIQRRTFIRRTATAAFTGLAGAKILSAMAGSHPDSSRKIYVFSKHLQWLGYEEMAKIAAAIGFDGVDITVRPGGHVLPENVERDLPKAVEAMRRQRLTADTITTAITGTDSPHMKKILQTASKLGIKQYRMGWLKYDDSLGISENIEKFGQRFAVLARVNEQFGIRGDYQNHAGAFLGSSVWDLREVLRTLDSKWLGCRYDIRHAIVEGNLSWPIDMKAISPFIRSLDIKDFTWIPGEKNKIVNVPLGTGVVDFGKYMTLLSEYGIKGNITLHFEYPIGGAEHGKTNIPVSSQEAVIEAMKRDLKTLRGIFPDG